MPLHSSHFLCLHSWILCLQFLKNTGLVPPYRERQRSLYLFSPRKERINFITWCFLLKRKKHQQTQFLNSRDLFSHGLILYPLCFSWHQALFTGTKKHCTIKLPTYQCWEWQAIALKWLDDGLLSKMHRIVCPKPPVTVAHLFSHPLRNYNAHERWNVVLNYTNKSD